MHIFILKFENPRTTLNLNLNKLEKLWSQVADQVSTHARPSL